MQVNAECAAPAQRFFVTLQIPEMNPVDRVAGNARPFRVAIPSHLFRFSSMISRLVRRWSIKTKLMLGMAACLLLFIVISAVLSASLTGKSMRARVVDQELPAVVGEIRNDVLRQISGPLTASLGIAGNTYVHAWERAGLDDAGLEAWRAYAGRMKAESKAATVFWASPSTLKFMDETGLSYMLEKDNPRDAWMSKFLAGGQAYELNMNADPKTGELKLFINTRADAGDGKLAVAASACRSMRSANRCAPTRSARPAMSTWCARMARSCCTATPPWPTARTT